MSGSPHFVVWLYEQALRLYPRAYRDEYGAEMAWVFEQAIKETAPRGSAALVKLMARELLALPEAIAQEHQRARSMQAMSDEKQALRSRGGSWSEVLAALAPFLLLGIVPSLLGLTPLSGRLGIVLGIAILSLLGGSVLVLGILGLVKGLPRWLLPYGGILLATVTATAMGLLIWKLKPPFWPPKAREQWFVRHIAFQGVTWAGILILPPILVWASSLIPPLRPIYRRIRQDWTLVSFGLYGSALPALVISFDDYRRAEPYMLAAVILLAIGGWLYLRSQRPWQRMLSLFGGLTLSMAVGAAGRAILFGRADYDFPVLYYTPQTEALSTAIMGAWIAIALLIPALLLFLPSAGKQGGWKASSTPG
jgi:hypothetical protein